MVEFTLVFPIILIILLTVGDFGRYFAMNIAVESVARTAAETAALQFLSDETESSSGTVDHNRIHTVAWQSVCDEARGLPGVVVGGGGSECTGIPTFVCVHDGLDACIETYNDGAGVPAGCTAIVGTGNSSYGGGDGSRYVEVRVCYTFSTFAPVTVPFIGGSLSSISGDFFIQKSRVFTVADY